MSAAMDLLARRSLHWASWVVLYTLAAVLGRATIVEGSQLALVWPAAGIGFAWVLWALRRQGLAAARAAVLGVAVLTSAVAAVAGVAVSIAVAFGVAHGLLVAVGVWVLVRAGGPRVAMLQTPRDLWVLLLAAVSGSVASAAVGPTAVILLAADTPAAYGLWVVRNAVSVILVLACALAVRHPVRDQQSPGSRAELVAAAVAAVVGYALVFAPANGLPVAFAVLSVSVWAGLRFDKQVAAVFAAGGGAAVVLATINDRGAFADIGGSAGIVVAQAFIATVTLVTLVLALQREVQARLAHHLTMSEERFRSAFEAAPVCMLMAPLEAGGRLGPVVRTNSDLSTFVGRSVEELLGSRVELLVDEQDRPVFSHLVEHLCSPDGAERVELRFRHADGGTVWGVVSLARISVEGADATVLCLVEDVTARKAAEAALTRQALHDNLTGLPNRTLLADRLGRATRVPDGTRAGLIYLDLDGFKLHNDHLGHSGGDELLARVGGRIAGCVGTIDTVARLGGDEYAVLCEDLSTQAELEGIADRIRATLTEPLHVAGSAVMVQASIGMVLAEPEEAAESVLRRAERAMSAVKHGGRPGSSLVSPEQARAARTLRLLPELERAVADDEFVMFGQPVVDVATGRIVAVETLVRWRHPQRGLLPPSEFLDVLESSSLMSEAGIQILGKSLRMARDWYDVLGHEAPLVHVNVSGAQLQDGHLSEALRAAQAAAGVPMSQIVLELTETHAPLISDSLLSDVGALRRDGVRIALDDLGTGYSSLQRITELPTDILKIDRRFVAGLGSDPRCSAIVRGVLSMSQALGLSVIAEGVETEEQHELLRQHDCDTAQGYLYARPMPADELLETLVGTRSLLPR